MKNFRRRRGRKAEPVALVPAVGAQPITVKNPYRRVAQRNIVGHWVINPPHSKRFSREVSRAQIADGLRSEIGAVDMRLSDMRFMVLEHDSWVDLQLWVKRFLADIDYRYLNDRRDCDKFARAMRTAADLLGDVNAPGAPLLGGIYAHMDEPFAGITDGYHALNLSLTSEGAFVSEPQGIDLTYQALRPWAQTRRIATVFSD